MFKKIIMMFFLFLFILILSACSNKDNNIRVEASSDSINSEIKGDKMEKVTKTEEEWKKELTPEQYKILREKGTERAFTGKFENFDGEGIYKCAACGNYLFTSETKYHSGCGWPSFYDEIKEGNIIEKEDSSHGMVRTEVVCAKCESHLGHVFEDGPPPTGLRYCINSAALEFEEK